VLVADDSDSLRSLVRITLTSQGWSVREAATAEAALALTRETRPDLVILDITFGDTGPDGLAVCAELKADPATATIPIVMLTAHDDPAMRRRAKAAQANAFVTKPFGPLDLMRTMRELVPAASPTPALGVLLLDAGAVESTVLEAALAEQQDLVDRGMPKRLGDVLLERGRVSGGALDRALLEQMHSRATRDAGSKARVLVIDDHAAVREGIKSLIGEDETMEVVGEAVDAEEGLRLARRHHPDVIVIDNEMPGRSGIDLLPWLRADVPSAKLVMFSLNGAVRERALAAGAHVFITKDAPMDQILDALRPHGPAAPAPTPQASAHIPRFPYAHHLRRSALVISAILAGYVVLFFAAEPSAGAGAAAYAVIPSVAIGALLGPEAGILGAVLTVVLTAALWAATGHAAGEPVIRVGEQGFGVVALLLLGFAAGAMRVVGVRFDPRKRRVEAIAEASRALAGMEPGEFIDVFLEAMLHVLPGDLALLYSNAAGDARFVSASRPAPGLAPETLAPLVRETMRSATPRTIDELGVDERPITTARAAVLVPVSVAGQEVRGVLVVVDRERARFGPDDLIRLRPFAQYLWIVLRSTPIKPGRAAAQVRERTS